MIKDWYKAKKVTDRTWVEGQLIVSHTGNYWIVVDYNETSDVVEKYRVDEGTLCRWTGYLDMYGNKIFKNDICMYDGSPTVVNYGEYYSKDYDCPMKGWYHVSKGYAQKFQFEILGIEVIDNIHDESKLRTGSVIYIFNTFLPDGSVNIVEAQVQEVWDDGKMVAQSVNDESSWILYQSYLNRVVFRTREEAKEALKKNNECTKVF